MKKIVSLVSLALAAAGAVAGCSVDTTEGGQNEAVGSAEAAACLNLDGTNAMLASLATAIATELHRVEINQDFEIYRGMYNQEMLRIKQSSRGLCTNNCRNIDALLVLQDPRNDQLYVFKDGTKLNSWTFASRLVAGYRAQQNCVSNGNCATEWHYLEKTSSTPTTCGGVDYGLNMVQFKVSKANAYGQKLSPEQALLNPENLQRKLLWTDPDQSLPATGNPYLQFRIFDNRVGCEMDPGGGTSEEPIPPATCGTSSLKFSPVVDVTGTCCTVSSIPGATVYRKTVMAGQSGFTGWFKCQL